MRWLRPLLFRTRAESELDAELRFHVEELVEEHVRRGRSPLEARRLVEGEFGRLERIKQDVREARRSTLIEAIVQDFRYGVRQLRRSLSFSILALFTLALGIGVNAAIFSVVYAVLLRPLPYSNPEQLGLIWSDFHRTGGLHGPTSGPAFRELERRTRSFQSLAAIWTGNGTFTGDANPEQVKVGSVTPNFLDVLGVKPVLGRLFLPEETFNGRRALVLNHAFWRRRFAADPNVVGKSFRFQGSSATVVGVLPPDFQLLFPADANVPDVQVYLPFQYDIAQGPRTLYYLRIIGRLKPGITFTQAQQDLNQAAGQMRAVYSEFATENLALTIVSMHADAVRDVRPTILAVFCGAVLVLLICCVNITNLLLARTTQRQREIAVRSSLGASPARIARQMFAEGLVLCAGGAAAGTFFGWAGLRLLYGLRPDSLTRLRPVELEWPVVLFIAAISLAPALLFAFAPMLDSARTDLAGRLRVVGRAGQSGTGRRLRSALIVSEIGIGLMLLVGAGLMIRTVLNLHRVQAGFDPVNVLTFDLAFTGSRYVGDVSRATFVKDWESKVGTIPGVESVGSISHLPLDDYPNWYSPFRPEGVDRLSGSTMLADHRAITPAYFTAIGTRLRDGRYFDVRDLSGAQPVVIVDELLAQTCWPGKRAVGRKIEVEHFNGGGFAPKWSEVVGVVEHVRHHSLAKQLRGQVYIPYEQSPREHLSFVVRTRPDPMSIVPAARRELRGQDPDLAMSKVRPMTAYVERASAPASFTAILASIFAAFALALAGIGIYGVVHYSVQQRTQEMGVRIALGATSGAVKRMVMKEGLGLAAAGILLGLCGSALAARPLQSLIYGVSSYDPITYASALAIIPAAVLIGCWIPARRAASADPMTAIRAE